MNFGNMVTPSDRMRRHPHGGSLAHRAASFLAERSSASSRPLRHSAAPRKLGFSPSINAKSLCSYINRHSLQINEKPPSCFQALTHSFAQVEHTKPFIVKALRTLSAKHGGGGTPQSTHEISTNRPTLIGDNEGAPCAVLARGVFDFLHRRHSSDLICVQVFRYASSALKLAFLYCFHTLTSLFGASQNDNRLNISSLCNCVAETWGVGVQAFSQQHPELPTARPRLIRDNEGASCAVLARGVLDVLPPGRAFDFLPDRAFSDVPPQFFHLLPSHDVSTP